MIRIRLMYPPPLACCPTRLGVARCALAAASFVPSCRWRPRPQATDAQQIVGRADEVGGMLRARHAAESRLAQAADRLQPPKDLFHPLADSLTERIAHVPRRPAIQARRAPAGDLREVRPNPAPPQAADKLCGVVALVGPEGARPNPPARLTPAASAAPCPAPPSR